MLRKCLTVAAGVVAVWSASAGEIGGAAPDFDLASRDGGRVALGDLEGQVVMVNFWATWCGPCREEIPHLDALYRRYSDLGFMLLGVNVEEDASGADAYL
ncbi:MAG: TlpA family protein disulfide reductase, partial [Gammaproteobacteria bacterium]